MVKHLFNSANLLVSIYCLFTLWGCATHRQVPTFQITERAPGFYHNVQKGETLWSIAKMYDVNLQNILVANHLSDASKLDTGQLLFIPKEAVPQNSKSPLVKNEKFIWPLKGKIISTFGSQKGQIINKGIDIQGREGTYVLAARSGRVVFCSERLKGYGKVVVIEHGDGYLTLYAHNSKILVSPGQYIRRGETVAKVGSTGRSSMPFLHFEIRKGHEPQNPMLYLP
jgi:murein DD-endopeptidase MepM/ murein hydrolase activator NlpD